MEHLYLNDSDPRIIAIGLLIAVICGILGAVVVIHFRDIANRDNRRYDNSPHSDHSGSYTVGGYSSLFVCIFLGCVSFFLLQKAPRRMELSRQMNEAFEVYSPKDSSRNSTRQLPARVYPADWVNHQWTADETPYRQIRDEVDLQMIGDKKFAQVTEDAMENAFTHFKNPLAMYRWGYAAYKQAYQACYHSHSTEDAREAEISQSLSDADYQMQQVPNPQSYSYSRLIFLLRAMREFTQQYVSIAESADIEQGEFLIDYKPDDWEVKEALALMLATHRNLDYKKRAIQYASEVVRANPKSPQAWQTLGLAFHSIGTVSEKRRGDDIDYAAKAIEAYQKCLQLAPPDYGPREKLESTILTIRVSPHLWITETKYQ